LTAMKKRLTAVSLGLAAAAAVFLLVVPVYSGFRDNQLVRATLLQQNGTWVIIPVMLPVGIALVPLAIPKQAVRVIAAILMGAFALIAMSIGLFYFPAEIMMILAACVGDAAKLRDAVP